MLDKKANIINTPHLIAFLPFGLSDKPIICGVNIFYMRGVKIDLTGQRFGRLTVIKEAPKRANSTSSVWLCQCECGGHAIVGTCDLKTGHTKSCGCFIREKTAERNVANATHGHSRMGKISHEYNIWAGIKERCYNENHTYYSYYGGRGITMYDEWINNFESFVLYIGIAPSPKLTIDRIDNNGNYEPGNLRWATRKEQANNRSNTRYFEYKGEMKTISELAEIANMSYYIIKGRLTSGWNVEIAMNTPRLHKYHARDNKVKLNLELIK